MLYDGPRTGETSGFSYRRMAAGWSKRKIVTKHNPRCPRPRWSWSKEKYRSFWDRCAEKKSPIMFLKLKLKQKLCGSGIIDSLFIAFSYVKSPLKSRSFNLKCTLPPINHDGSVDSSFAEETCFSWNLLFFQQLKNDEKALGYEPPPKK